MFGMLDGRGSLKCDPCGMIRGRSTRGYICKTTDGIGVSSDSEEASDGGLVRRGWRMGSKISRRVSVSAHLKQKHTKTSLVWEIHDSGQWAKSHSEEEVESPLDLIVHWTAAYVVLLCLHLGEAEFVDPVYSIQSLESPSVEPM